VLLTRTYYHKYRLYTIVSVKTGISYYKVDLKALDRAYSVAFPKSTSINVETLRDWHLSHNANVIKMLQRTVNSYEQELGKDCIDVWPIGRKVAMLVVPFF